MARQKGPRAWTRPARTSGSSSGAAATVVDAPETAAPKKRRTSPAQFIREVRAEGRKITWTSRKETWITSVMVFIMVTLAALFFFVVDTGLAFASRNILAIGQ